MYQQLAGVLLLNLYDYRSGISECGAAVMTFQRGEKYVRIVDI